MLRQSRAQLFPPASFGPAPPRRILALRSAFSLGRSSSAFGDAKSGRTRYFPTIQLDLPPEAALGGLRADLSDIF